MIADTAKPNHGQQTPLHGAVAAAAQHGDVNLLRVGVLHNGGADARRAPHGGERMGVQMAQLQVGSLHAIHCLLQSFSCFHLVMLLLRLPLVGHRAHGASRGQWRNWSNGVGDGRQHRYNVHIVVFVDQVLEGPLESGLGGLKVILHTKQGCLPHVTGLCCLLATYLLLSTGTIALQSPVFPVLRCFEPPISLLFASILTTTTYARSSVPASISAGGALACSLEVGEDVRCYA
mmetsp:Transcript_11882/g.21417  ORF Transcript_11882/g.21417 Transcript_11882/m.21417 type:complete len:233 (+) Transcript_11882:925-1623(+)